MDTFSAMFLTQMLVQNMMTTRLQQEVTKTTNIILKHLLYANKNQSNRVVTLFSPFIQL